MTRTWTLDLPDQPHHAPNSRSGHWRARYDATRAWREAAAWVAKGDSLPQVERPVVITLTVTPPDRRRRDVDSFALAYKAAVDGLRDAGVIADDSWTHVPEMRIRVAEPDGTKCWRWRLEIAEVNGG